jgi:hypothetical protein
MRRSLWVTLTLASLGLNAQANDGMESTLKSRAMASASASAVVTSISSEAPFTQARDPLPEMILRDEQERRVVNGTCQHSGGDLCYDLADRRIVYRPIRQYMPKFEGLTPENISLKRDRIVIKYSFR